MKHSLLILSFLIVSGCNQKTVSGSGSTSTGNINVNAPYKWASTVFPLDLQISNDFDVDELTDIQSMSAKWELAVQSQRNFFTDTNRTADVSTADLDLDGLGDDGVFGIYKITDWPDSLNASALAVTQIFGLRHNVGDSDEHVLISHADILVNDHIYDFRTAADAVDTNTFDFRTVVLHEMGHFLGLAHNNGDSVMIPAIDTDDINVTPTSLDAANLANRYGVTLSLNGSAMATGAKKVYIPRDAGEKIRILIELMPDGECIHKENGAVIQRHIVKLK